MGLRPVAPLPELATIQAALLAAKSALPHQQHTIRPSWLQARRLAQEQQESEQEEAASAMALLAQHPLAAEAAAAFQGERLHRLTSAAHEGLTQATASAQEHVWAEWARWQQR